MLGVALLVPAPARGNGWAHAGIPFEALLRGLDFEQPETRQRAAESLGFRGQREAVEPLLKRLNLPEESPHVRSALYLALGRLRDTRATPALTRCLDIESREEVRSDCAAALGLLGDVTTAPRLVRALRADACRPHHSPDACARLKAKGLGRTTCCRGSAAVGWVWCTRHGTLVSTVL